MTLAHMHTHTHTQINTVPMMSQVGFIEVVVPPQILASESSTDVIATEGSNVSLICRASGHPDPHILWKREDRSEIPLQTPQGKKYSGTTVCLPSDSRYSSCP